MGQTTFPNMMALLGGMEANDNPCLGGDGFNKMDDCPLMFREFSRVNYVTGFTEDWPRIAIFNYKDTGFVSQPSDYYYRPFTTAYFSETSNCTGGKTGLSETESHLKYVTDFLKEMGKDAGRRNSTTTTVGNKSTPFFLFSYFTQISHNSMNTLKVRPQPHKS